jgi:hypothetical protein
MNSRPVRLFNPPAPRARAPLTARAIVDADPALGFKLIALDGIKGGSNRRRSNASFDFLSTTFASASRLTDLAHEYTASERSWRSHVNERRTNKRRTTRHGRGRQRDDDDVREFRSRRTTTSAHASSMAWLVRTGYLLKHQAQHNTHDCPTSLSGCKSDYSPDGEAAAESAACVVAASTTDTEYELADQEGSFVCPRAAWLTLRCRCRPCARARADAFV